MATVQEALSSLLTKPGRTALGLLSTTLGAAMTVAAVGISLTSAHQVSDIFDGYEQTQISIRMAVGETGHAEIRDGAKEDFLALEGVAAVTGLAVVDETAVPILAPFTMGRESGIDVVAVDESLASTLELGSWQGRDLDVGFHSRSEPVAVVGVIGARELGLSPPYGREAVEIGGHRVVVLGVFSSSPRQPGLMQQVLVPRSWAESVDFRPRTTQILVRTRVGATEPIADRAAMIADPYQPERILVSAPPTVEQLRSRVSGEIDSLVALTSIGAMVVGSLGIAHASFVNVLRRRGEFALRQALGMTQLDLALLVVVEGAVLGFVAGTLGVILGLLVLASVAVVQDWTPLLSPIWLAIVLVTATGLGSVMSLYPASRAAAIEPAIGLREL